MKRTLCFFIMLLSMLGSTGCGMTHIQDRSSQDVKKYDARGRAQIQDIGFNMKTNPAAMEGRLNSLSGINKSSVVVYGDSIFIGFRRDPNYSGTNDALARKILGALYSDAKHNQLYIVSNPNLVSRIESISQRIHNGQSVTRQELQKLMNDVGLVVRPVNLIEKT